jgi:hypothetical protein
MHVELVLRSGKQFAGTLSPPELYKLHQYMHVDGKLGWIVLSEVPSIPMCNRVELLLEEIAAVLSMEEP